MFDIGFWELGLIAVIALLVVGPERLPSLARTVGLWVGKARGIMLTLRDEIEREVELDEVRKAHQDTKSELVQAQQEMREFIEPVSGPPRASPSPFKSQEAAPEAAAGADPPAEDASQEPQSTAPGPEEGAEKAGKTAKTVKPRKAATAGGSRRTAKAPKSAKTTKTTKTAKTTKTTKTTKTAKAAKTTRTRRTAKKPAGEEAVQEPSAQAADADTPATPPKTNQES